MGVINVKVDDKVEMDFRMKVLERKGKEKGALSKAIEEAMQLWIIEKDN